MSEKCDETGTNHRGMRNVIVMTRKMMLMLRNMMLMMRNMMLMLRNMMQTTKNVMLTLRNMMLMMRNVILLNAIVMLLNNEKYGAIMPRSMMVKYQRAASSPTILPAGSRELVRAACQVKCF